MKVETSKYKTPYNEFARSNSLKKQVLKRKIDETIQNIELLQKQLEKYGAGLSWLREPSRERDEKAEHLEKIQEEPQKAASTPSTPAAKPVVGTPRASVGTPVGTKPSVGTPVKPQIGTPGGAPKPTVGTPKQTEGAPRPQVETPVGTRPQVGTPKPVEKKDEKKND